VVEQEGIILVTPKSGDGSQAAEFLNITNRNPNSGTKNGLLSIAFHPDFQSNHLCYIYYHKRTGSVALSVPQCLSEWKFPATTRTGWIRHRSAFFWIFRTLCQPQGGLLTFGRDGYFIWASGTEEWAGPV